MTMSIRNRQGLAVLGAALLFATLDAGAQQQPAGSVQTPSGQPARPRDPTVNLPSDTGSQTTTPGGAATGAGQAQGMTRQPDVGSPGGLEQRARRQDRAAGDGVVQKPASRPAAAQERSAAPRASTERGPRPAATRTPAETAGDAGDPPRKQRRAPRASKG